MEACTRCAEGYMLEDWRCVQTCSSGYYLAEQLQDNRQLQRSCRKWVLPSFFSSSSIFMKFFSSSPSAITPLCPTSAIPLAPSPLQTMLLFFSLTFSLSFFLNLSLSIIFFFFHLPLLHFLTFSHSSAYFSKPLQITCVSAISPLVLFYTCFYAPSFYFAASF